MLSPYPGITQASARSGPDLCASVESPHLADDLPLGFRNWLDR